MSRAILRNIGWLFAWKGVHLVIGSVSVVLLARILGIEEFGVLTWMLSASILLALLAELGVSSASARMLAEQEMPPRTVLLVSGLILSFLVLITCLAVILLSSFLATVLNAPFLEEFGWLLALLTFVAVGERFCAKAFEGLRRPDILARTGIWISWIGPAAAVLGVIIIARSAHVALTAKSLAGLFLIGLLCFNLYRRTSLAGKRRDRNLQPGSDPPSPVGIGGKLVGYSVPLFFVALSFVIYTQSDVLLIQWLLDSEQVGVYGSAIRIVEVLAVAGAAIGAGSASFFPGARARGQEEYSALFLQATRGVLLVYLPLAGGLLLTAGQLMPLVFGEEFGQAGLILAVYTPFIVCRGLSSVYSLSLDYLGFGGGRAVAVSVSAAANIVLNLFLIPRFGILGAAVASQVTYVPLVCGYGFLLMRKSQTSAAALLRAVNPILASTALMMAAVGLGRTLGLPVLASVAVGLVTYPLMAIRLRALTNSDLAALVPVRRAKTSNPLT